VSNEALCVITGLITINIKIDETVAYYEYVKGKGNLFDREMEVKYCTGITQRRLSKLLQHKKKANILYKYTWTAVRAKTEWNQEYQSLQMRT
jgi:hypothetical protein